MGVLLAVSDSVVTGIFTLGGVLAAGTVGWVSAWQTRRSAAAQAAIERERDQGERFAGLLRDGVVGVAEAWAEVVRADAARTQALDRAEDQAAARERSVHALTDLGAWFNRLLILPVSDDLEAKIMEVNAAVTVFRESEADAPARLRARDAVGRELEELFGMARVEGTV